MENGGIWERFCVWYSAAHVAQTSYCIGALCVDDEAKEVKVDGEVVKLTPIEYQISWGQINRKSVYAQPE